MHHDQYRSSSQSGTEAASRTYAFLGGIGVSYKGGMQLTKDPNVPQTANMNPITLEYLKFSVAKGFDLLAPAFSALRQTVARDGGVREQYFGLTDDGKNDLIWILSTYLAVL